MGVNLARHLLALGHSVRIFDIADFDRFDRGSVEMVKGDIRDFDTFIGALDGVDAIIHAAAALPLYTRKDIYSTDVDGTRNVLEAASRRNIKRVVYVSSTSVYGDPDHHPVYEDDRLCGVGHYSKAKILAEEICLEYRKKGICVPILRPKTFIGPERLGVFALFYDWAKDGKNFPIIGKGDNRYQFLDVDDLCVAIWLCLSLDSGKVNDTFNVGAKYFTTMKEDYQAVLDEAGFGKKVIGFPAAPVVMALRVLEFLHLSPIYKWVYETAGKDSFVSIEKAENILGFSPKYSNKEALLRNYRWYIENLSEFSNTSGISHRAPWRQGALRMLKAFF